MNNSINIDKYKSLCDSIDRDEILRNEKDYQLLYHFSSSRGNLYDWYSFKKDSKLLEIGAECGALTEYFGNKVAEVTAIESDPQMAEINKYRNRNSNNIEVICSDFGAFDTENRYDYIVLTGTLEVAYRYFNNENASKEILKKAKKLLSDDGIVLVAVTNRMGIRYLSGEVDVRMTRPFEGLSNNSDEVTLYTRHSIKKLFQETEFGIIEEYYPLPDYRFTSVIYSSDYLPSTGDYSVSRYSFSLDSFKVIDESMLANQLIEDGEFQNYADAYLFLLK